MVKFILISAILILPFLEYSQGWISSDIDTSFSRRVPMRIEEMQQYYVSDTVSTGKLSNPSNHFNKTTPEYERRKLEE